MIPNEAPQTLETAGQGIKVVGTFKITDSTQARILVSLSDKMYTRKELAFVREYSTNAADAQIVAKKPISEIIVDLPTLENLNFRIRDFGLGLTEKQIATVYCVFGESDKRNSDDLNGMLGYGCKAGFAHADSFTVASWVNGEKSVYQCVKGDSTKLHSALLLSRCPSDEPSGIEITIPVKQSSIWTVQREAADFYKHWPVIPTILNMTTDDKARMEKFRNNPPTLKGEGWEIRPKSDSNAIGVAYMGWVAYAIDWNVLFNRMSLTASKRVLFELLQSNDVTLFFKMGEVNFIDSRENLEYTDITLNAMMARIESIFSKIKDSIQDRFDPAPNIWEAKKFYNAIFRSGLIDVESGETEVIETTDRIKILDGNLMRLEQTFNGEFTWNGIPLKDARFNDINKFDNAHPAEVKDEDHEPALPVMVTYRKKKKRTKINRCTAEKNNDIVASDAVAIVVNDTGLKTGQAVIARYLIFRNDSKIKTVHVLTFENDKIKNNFNKELNFKTVPVLKQSELAAAAKAWNAANKVPRNYGGGATNTGVRPMRYMDVDNNKLEENDVPVREMEDGGIYIEEGELCRHGRRRPSTRTVRIQGFKDENPKTVLGYFRTLVEKTGIELDRVFIIGKQTDGTKWFTEAKESGNWISIWDYLKESLAGLDMATLIDASNHEDYAFICKASADKLTPGIKDKNSPLLKFIEIIFAKDYTDSISLSETLKQLALWQHLVGNTKGTIDFEGLKDSIDKQYPMLVEHYTTEILHNSYFEGEIPAKLTRYINAMDLFVDLGGDEVPATEPKATEEQIA